MKFSYLSLYITLATLFFLPVVASESCRNLPQGTLYTDAAFGNLNAIKCLIQQNAPLDKKIGSSEEPLLAILSAHSRLNPQKNFEAIKELVEAGASVNSEDKYGTSVLKYALFGGSLPLIRYLIKHGADPNVVGHKDKLTPLSNLLRSLAERVSDFQILEKENALPVSLQEALSLLRKERLSESRQRLRKFNADTVLPVLTLLHSLGADPFRKDGNELTAVDYINSDMLIITESERRRLLEALGVKYIPRKLESNLTQAQEDMVHLQKLQTLLKSFVLTHAEDPEGARKLYDAWQNLTDVVAQAITQAIEEKNNQNIIDLANVILGLTPHITFLAELLIPGRFETLFELISKIRDRAHGRAVAAKTAMQERSAPRGCPVNPTTSAASQA